jgi:type III secretory pathway component EscU
MMLVIREYLLVIATTTRIATTLAYLPPFELSELGVPRATKTMDLGRDKTTVVMYSQNFIPVQENRGLARSMRTGSVFSHCC